MKMPKYDGKQFIKWSNLIFCIQFITQSIQYYLEVAYDYRTERKVPVYGLYRYTDAGLINTRSMQFNIEVSEMSLLRDTLGVIQPITKPPERLNSGKCPCCLLCCYGNSVVY